MDGQKNVACLDAKCWSWAFLALVCLLSCLFFSAQTSHLVWFGLGMPWQSRQRPSSLARALFSAALRRWSSFRSGRLLLIRSRCLRASRFSSGVLGVTLAEVAFLLVVGRFVGAFCSFGVWVLAGLGALALRRLHRFTFGRGRVTLKVCVSGTLIPMNVRLSGAGLRNRSAPGLPT